MADFVNVPNLSSVMNQAFHSNIDKDKEDDSTITNDPLKFKYLQWSKDMASSARQYCAYVSKMEGKDVAKMTGSTPEQTLDIGIFWDPIRLEGYKTFMQLRPIQANTRHNQLKCLSVLLSELLITSDFSKAHGEIFMCWKRLRNWANLLKKVTICFFFL